MPSSLPLPRTMLVRHPPCRCRLPFREKAAQKDKVTSTSVLPQIEADVVYIQLQLKWPGQLQRTHDVYRMHYAVPHVHYQQVV